MGNRPNRALLIFLFVTAPVFFSDCLGTNNSVDRSGQKAQQKAGWSTPITSVNTGVPSEKLHLEGAPDSIEGLTIQQFVTDSNVQVRADAACSECHGWANEAARLEFCEHVSEFLCTNQDGAGPKPQVLKDVLSDWKNRGCPD